MPSVQHGGRGGSRYNFPGTLQEGRERKPANIITRRFASPFILVLLFPLMLFRRRIINSTMLNSTGPARGPSKGFSGFSIISVLSQCSIWIFTKAKRCTKKLCSIFFFCFLFTFIFLLYSMAETCFISFSLDLTSRSL